MFLCVFNQKSSFVKLKVVKLNVTFVISNIHYMLTTKKFDQLPHSNTLNIFIGNMLQLRKERINFFINQQQQLGDIYQVKIPTRKVVVITDPEWIKYVLVDNNKNYGKALLTILSNCF